MIGDDYFTIRARLGTALFSLQTLAFELAAPPESVTTLQQLQQSLREPFLFVVVGEVKAGKSSLLNAIFGREFSGASVLPATDRIHVFKYADEERTVEVTDRLTECHRNASFLRDFNIVDTPGTNTIAANHETITGQFVPAADLILFVFSAANPWSATAWSFLRLIEKKWLKRVAFVLQQSDLRNPDEITSIVAHLDQTMRERFDHTCPIFPVSAKSALAAKLRGEGGPEALAATGMDRLEKFINAEVATGDSRMNKLRTVCQAGQVLLGELGARARESMAAVERDTSGIQEIDHDLAERKEQSLRQIGGALWSMAQSYEKAQKRGEELLIEKLTLLNAVRLLFQKGRWQDDFEQQIELRLRGTIQQQIANAVSHLDTDLEGASTDLRESLEARFGARADLATFPAFTPQRTQLLSRIETTLAERGPSPEIGELFARRFATTAHWLRLPAFLIMAGAMAATAVFFTHRPLFDLTLFIAGGATLAGTALALFQRRRMLAEFRRQMLLKREVVLGGIEDHLRQAVEKFFTEFAPTIAPLQGACAAQRQLHEPMLKRLDQLTEVFGKNATDLGLAPPANPGRELATAS